MTIVLNHTIVPARDKDAAARFFARVQAEGIPWGSSPGNLQDRQLNDWNGGRGAYFCDPDGHVLELMTQPQ